MSGSEDARLAILRQHGIVTTSDLLKAMRCSRKTLDLLREHGLGLLEDGKECCFNPTAIAVAIDHASRFTLWRVVDACGQVRRTFSTREEAETYQKSFTCSPTAPAKVMRFEAVVLSGGEAKGGAT